jgi:quinol monooxygenase YgiN
MSRSPNIENTETIMAKMIIAGTIQVAAQDRTRFVQRAKLDIANSRAEAGCLSYVIALDLDRDDTFHLSEVWSDKAALDGHLASPGFRAMLADVSTMAITAWGVMLYEAGESSAIAPPSRSTEGAS